jgi:hypothetical protein
MADNDGSKKAVPDIPELKEKEKERKGGAVVVGGQSSGSPGILYRWFGVGGQGAAGGAARVGAGAASKAGGAAATAAKGAALGTAAAAPKYGLLPTLVNFVGSNLGMAALSMALTGGAVYTLYTLGMKATDGNSGQARVFAKRDRGAPEIGPADEARVDASGLSYFQTANTGKAFDDEAAAGEGGEDELNDAASEEDAAVEELEGAEEGFDETTGGAPDLAEAMNAEQKSKLKLAKSMGGTSKFGKSSPGLSGGFSQPFQKLERSSPKASAKQGRITDLKRKKTGKLAARKMSSAKRGGKGAMNQLKFASRKSRGAIGQSSTEGAAFEAAEAFNTAPIGQGAKGIAGGGVSQGGDGITPASDGGPIGSNVVNPQQDAPDTGKGEDKSPWTQMVMMAMALLTTASTIITIIGILAVLKKIPFMTGVVTPIQQMLLGMAAGMAAASTAMGVQIMTEYGQKEQGGILTAGGAITTASAMAALMWPNPTTAWVAVIGGIAGIAASVGSLLAGGGMGGMGGGGKK